MWVFRTWPHQAHITKKNVDQLWQFINLGAAQKTAHARDPVVVRRGNGRSSLVGIITLGAAAALGEEMVFRGALQPRFGILLTALLFALLHNQYGVSLATLVVFILGLVLGWTRKYINTTTSMFVHATYNITLALISLMASNSGWGH